MIINLGKETLDKLKEHGKTVKDVRWVGGYGFCSGEWWETMDGFLAWAMRKNYDNGFGGAEIDESLVIVGDDWWLERAEYDGAEWWEFKTLPRKDGRRKIDV